MQVLRFQSLMIFRILLPTSYRRYMFTVLLLKASCVGSMELCLCHYEVLMSYVSLQRIKGELKTFLIFIHKIKLLSVNITENNPCLTKPF